LPRESPARALALGRHRRGHRSLYDPSRLSPFCRFATAAGLAPSQDCDPCLISDLAAVVTVTDDGGSSGRLRKDFNILAPGDLRNCMVALSEDEGLISRLFRHRFQAGGGLAGAQLRQSLRRRPY
jgi:hypothetical protein